MLRTELVLVHGGFSDHRTNRQFVKPPFTAPRVYAEAVARFLLEAEASSPRS